MDIQIKIKEYINKEKISFREFAKKCGMPNSTLQSICERGINSASFQNAGKIASVLGVSLSEFASANVEGGLSSSEAEMVEKFRELDNRGKSVVTAILNHEYAQSAVSEKPAKKYQLQFASDPKADYIKITKREQTSRLLKVFSQPAAAGYGNYIDDESFEEITIENVPIQADFGVRITGNSMEPHINNGDIAFVQKTETLKTGDVGIYIIEGEAFCKKLIQKEGTFYLHSFNEKYQDFPLPQEAYLIGKVIM